MGIDWEKYGEFERFPRLEVEMEKSVTVVFKDDGREVDAETLNRALKDKGHKIKGRDSVVFNVSVGDDTKELWVSAANYTNMGELKKIRAGNNNTLVGAKVAVTRIAEGEPDKPNLKFVKAE